VGDRFRRTILLLAVLGGAVTAATLLQHHAEGSPTLQDGHPRVAIATQGSDAAIRGNETSTGSQLLVVSQDGNVLLEKTEHDNYWDIDPVSDAGDELLVTASNLRSPDNCDGTDLSCSEVRIERKSLETGEGETIYTRQNPIARSAVGRGNSSRWHDVDYYNSSHLVAADIYRNSIEIIEISSGETTWTWHAEEEYSRESGGPKGDWTHINDVERLPDGVVMASLRNQGSVVFVDPGDGLIRNRTLGSDGDLSALYEQHNPDYLHGERGETVLVADSENNRIIEYGWTGGGWTPVWNWSDDQLSWPRDADRLPDGDTLITDSRGDRVALINASGAVTWRYSTDNPYEAEALGTGPESTGGPTAMEIEAREKGKTGVLSLIPPDIVNIVTYFSPAWLPTTTTLIAVPTVVLAIVYAVARLRESEMV